MALNTAGKLEVTDLDFDTIKTNLKTYLKGQAEFTDYDFEGGGLNILLDVLAYNTHYNAFMANMAANEMFLDTAVKRNSVVSHAKALGYTPVSVTAPAAYINVTVNDATGGSLTMSAGHVFTTNVSGVLPFANGGSGAITPLRKGTSYAAVNRDYIIATAGSITITLPASPTAGDTVTIKDGTGAAATTSFTVARNGSPIASAASDLTFDKNWAEIVMTYIDGSIGWSV